MMNILHNYSLAWRSGRYCAYMAHQYGNKNPEDDCNDPARVNGLSEHDREVLLRWIEKTMIPRKTTNQRYSSYGLKHIYQDDTGEYVNNGEFKGAMILAGFLPHDATALNPHYSIKTLK